MKFIELMYDLSHGLMTEGCQHDITITLENEDYENFITREFAALKGLDKDKFTFYNMRGVDVHIVRKI